MRLTCPRHVTRSIVTGGFPPLVSSPLSRPPDTFTSRGGGRCSRRQIPSARASLAARTQRFGRASCREIGVGVGVGRKSRKSRYKEEMQSQGLRPRTPKADRSGAARLRKIRSGCAARLCFCGAGREPPPPPVLPPPRVPTLLSPAPKSPSAEADRRGSRRPRRLPVGRRTVDHRRGSARLGRLRRRARSCRARSHRRGASAARSPRVVRPPLHRRGRMGAGKGGGGTCGGRGKTAAEGFAPAPRNNTTVRRSRSLFLSRAALERSGGAGQSPCGICLRLSAPAPNACAATAHERRNKPGRGPILRADNRGPGGDASQNGSSRMGPPPRSCPCVGGKHPVGRRVASERGDGTHGRAARSGSDVLWTAGGILIMSSVAWLFGEIGHTVLIAVAAALDLKRGAPPLLNPILRWHLRRNLNRWPGIYSAVGRRLGVDGLAERWHLAVQPERA